MKVLTKKLARDMYKSWGQALAVAAVVFCGVASYVSVASAHRNLLLTRDTYYAQYRLADFFILLERAPRTAIFKLEAIPGVREARGRVVKDVNLDVEGFDESRIGRIISMPDRPEPVLNDICMMSGRYFEKGTANEVILSQAFARENGLEIGDSLDASINNKKHTLRVVGTALSPEYVYMIRSAQDFIPSPERFGVLWVAETFAERAFNMEGACNDIVGAVDDPEQLEQILDRADKILKPYGVFAKIKRKDQISNNFLSSEITGLGVTAKIVPTIFLGIAALVLLVLLNRMVRQERTQIGLLKAYGYSNWTVALHYVRFALVLGIVGSLGGFLTGQLLARGMIRMYVDFFEFPLLRSRVYPNVVLQAVAMTMVFATLGAVGAARRAARIQPAEAMRPPAPRSGHRTIFERMAALWGRLSFTWKMIVRNTSRYKFRAAITVLGVTVSAATLFLGWFLMDAMEYLLEFQFTQTQREDVRVMLALERGKSVWHDFRRMDHVRRAEPLLLYPFEARNAWRKKDIAITGIHRDSELLRLMDTQGRTVDVGETGLVLGEKLAEQLAAQAGDVVTLKPLLGRIKRERHVPVSKVVRQYLGMGAYMDLDALSRVLDESFVMNAVLLRTGRDGARQLNKDLKDVAAVSTVEIKEDSYQNLLDTMAESMRIMNVVVLVFSGVIAFAVIYNSTIVSLVERQRELASLRVMGFTTSEVGRIMYNENFLLSAAGLILGIPVGVGLCRAMVEAYDTDLYRFPFHLEPRTFVLTVVFSIVFVLLANLAAHRRVLRLDMVEVLKARE